MVDHWLPWVGAHCCPSFAVKGVSWSEAMQGGIPSRWICQDMDNSFGRSITDKKSKSTPRVSLSVRSKSYPLHVEGSSLVFPKDDGGLHWGLSVSLCCRQIRLEWWTVHGVELMHNLCHCCLGHSDLWGLWATAEVLGKEANWCPENRSFYLPDYKNPSLL